MKMSTSIAPSLIVLSLTFFIISSSLSASSMYSEYENKTGKFLNEYHAGYMRSLTFRNCNMTALNKSDFLPFSSVTHVTIISCSLDFPRQGILFSLLPDLTYLRIVNSNISENISIAFVHNEDIKTLFLRGNKIKIVRKNFLSGLSRIEDVDLSNNEIELIEEGAFDELKFLKKVNLTNNEIGAKFHRKYVTLPSSECIVCVEYVHKNLCSEEDLAACEENRNLDQLWWMTPRVTIQLNHNPVCANIVHSPSYTTQALTSTSKSTPWHTSQCMIKKSEKCYKHERRDIFLFEACGLEEETLDIKGFEIPSDEHIVEGEGDTKNEVLTTYIRINYVTVIVMAVLIIVSILLIVIARKRLFNSHSKRNYPSETPSHDSVQLTDVRTVLPVAANENEDSTNRNDVCSSSGDLSNQRDTYRGNNTGERKPLLHPEDNSKFLNEDGNTELHLAVRKGRKDDLKSLLNQSNSINVRNNRGETPLYLAVHGQQTEIVDMLLKHFKLSHPSTHTTGTDSGREDVISIIDEDKNTLLHIAASKGNHRITDLLLQHGAKKYVNAHNKFEQTPLHLAAKKGHTKVVKQLLNVGAHRKSTDKNRNTPLHLATRRGTFGVVKLLMANNAKNNDGEILVDVCAKNNEGNTALHEAGFFGRDKLFSVLFNSQKIDINIGNKKGQTPLMMAAKKGHMDTVEQMLRRGADVNKPDDEGHTALFFAAREGHLDVVGLLLSQGAKVNTGGDTPLHAAIRIGHEKIAEILMEEGASLDAPDDKNVTPRDLATDIGWSGLIEQWAKKQSLHEHTTEN